MAKSELAPDDRHLYVIALSACRGEYVPAEEFVSDRYDALVAIEPAMEGHLFRLARLLALLSALCGDLDAVWMAPNEWEALMDDQSPDAAAFCGLVRYDGHLHFLHPFIARLFLSQIDYGGRTEHWREGQPVPRHFLYNEWHASLSVLCQHLVTRRAPTGQPSSIVERLLSRREDDALFFPPLVQNIVNFSSHEPIAQRSELLDDVLGEFTPEHKLQYPRFSIDEPFRLLIRSRANRFWGKTLPNYLRLAVEDARQAWKLLAPTEHDNLSRNNLVTALYALLSHLGPEPQTQVELLLEEFVGHCRHLCVSRVPLQLQRYFYKLRERGFSLPDHMTDLQ
ncbi:hypothetical protein CAOG_05843 [Capsaspora owczarzaki ATCC 30864]|uniref:hypothetical protein n=1 Tax=Capsaspora owczarzaki (strain ATCC 30864) TaxID=595528 RepID=UPI0001FE33C6|nr:hypothetical protein CAOG_05843 [Capsaspora owczarzaki ATCC 30864]|eukprot:XP_004345433.1 hypothetical protein CAOG_05843 [Capsaspora owczarzaki ATCC 30864]